MRPRVIQLASYGGSYAGSFVPMLAAVARAAAERGYDTTFAFSREAEGRGWLGLLEPLGDIVFLPRTGLAARPEIGELLAPSRRTILHTHFGGFDEAAALAALGRRRTRVVWHLHTGNVRPVRLRSRMHAVVFGRLVDAFVCVSPTVRELALARGFPARRVIRHDNAIDVERFVPITPGERREARRALEVGPDAPVALHFGWDWWRKGGDRLLAAADALPDLPDLRLLTVLDAEPGDVPRDELAARPAVRPLPPRPDVRPLYAAADVFLSLSRLEGLPYAVLEALARGLPVVATDLPVHREVLDDLPGARLVTPEADAIAAATAELLAWPPAARDAHARAAREHVERTYALGPWAERLVDLYDRL